MSKRNDDAVDELYWLWRPRLTSDGGGAVLSDSPAALREAGIALDVGTRPALPVPVPLRIARKTSEPGHLDDCVRTYGKWALLASPKLKAVLDRSRVDNIDWYPLVIEDAIESRDVAYWCGNVLGAVDCIDRSRAVLDEYRMFRRMWIDPTLARGLPLFRISQHELHLVAHRSVKQAIELDRCTGIEFVPANGFCDLEAEPLPEQEDEDDKPYTPWC